MKKIIILFFIADCFIISAQLPTQGLLAHYPFAGNANDISPNNIHGTVFGASLTSDRFGNANNAYQFNGASNYISLPVASFTNLNVFSYSFWINPNALVTGIPFSVGESVFGKGQNVTFASTGIMNGAGYNVGANPSQSIVYSQNTVPVNQWTHVVMTRDLTGIQLYINGVLSPTNVNSPTNSQNASYGTNTPYRAYIGARSLGNSFFNGAIDDVRIYTTVLTLSEVSSLFNEACTLGGSSNTFSACVGSVATLSVNSTLPSPSLAWFSSPSSTTTLGTGSNFVTPVLNSSGTYTYYALQLTCWLPSVPVTILVSPLPTITVNSGTICAGELFTIVPQGASSYTFSGGSNIVFPSATTIYTVTGSSANGCQAANPATSTVTVNGSTVFAISSYSSICNGETAILYATGCTTYTWSTGVNSASIVISPSATANYTVLGSNNGCVGSFVISQHVSNCVGVSEFDITGTDLQIFPNPARDLIYVQLQEQISLSQYVLIEDVLGRVTKKLPIIKQQTTLQVELQTLTPGLYLISIVSDSGNKHSGKLLKVD